MKSSAFIAISLTLIMLLLVLSAAIFFLFQGRQELDEALQSLNEEIRIRGQQQAVLELEKSAAQSTVESLELLQATASLENMDLNEQLVKSDQLQATLEAQGEQLTANLVNANATVDIFKSLPPMVRIIGPESNDVIVGRTVDLIIVASDPAGLVAVSFNIGSDDFLGGPLEEVESIAFLRYEWTPTTEGAITVRVTATNTNGIINRPYLKDFTVILAPTSTPEPTATLEPTALPASP